jgi:hypothetical protein
MKEHERVELIEEYLKIGSDYQWHDNHGELIRCKDCIHKPKITVTAEEYENGFDIEFPDKRCPCQCEDGWYNWMPDDDWFCGNWERKEE